MSGLPIIPDLIVKNGAAFASSRDVAAVFGKRHADVLRSIDLLMAQLPEINQRNFALVSFVDDKGEARRAVDLDRDAFTLLAMGFTGAKALQFKLAYIEKFNAMEAEIRPRVDAEVVAVPRIGEIASMESRNHG